MSRSLKLFTLFGTPVRITYTWPIGPIIITVALGAISSLGRKNGLNKLRESEEENP